MVNHRNTVAENVKIQNFVAAHPGYSVPVLLRMVKDQLGLTISQSAYYRHKKVADQMRAKAQACPGAKNVNYDVSKRETVPGITDRFQAFLNEQESVTLEQMRAFLCCNEKLKAAPQLD
eukprot:PhM_4_TR16821/c4_g1_i1/m.47782